MHPGKRCRASHIWSGCERRDTSPMSECTLRLLMTFGALMNDWLHGRSLCPLGGAPLTCSPSCMHACRTLTLALALGSRSRCVINAFSHSPSVPASQSHLLTLARCALALARSLAQALVSLARSRSLTCSCARCSHSLARLLVRLLVRLLAALSLARMHVCAVLWLAALSLIALVRAALSLARSRSLRSRALCSRSLTRLRALRPPSLARAHCALARSQLCCPRGSVLHLPQ